MSRILGWISDWQNRLFLETTVMQIQCCPQCQRPCGQNELQDGCCPWCGGLMTTPAEPLAKTATPSSEAKPRSQVGALRVAVAFGCLISVALAVVVVTGWIRLVRAE